MVQYIGVNCFVAGLPKTTCATSVGDSVNITLQQHPLESLNAADLQ